MPQNHVLCGTYSVLNDLDSRNHIHSQLCVSLRTAEQQNRWACLSGACGRVFENYRWACLSMGCMGVSSSGTDGCNF